MNFGEFQSALEAKTAELKRLYPDGVVRVISIDNPIKRQHSGPSDRRSRGNPAAKDACGTHSGDPGRSR